MKPEISEPQLNQESQPVQNGSVIDHLPNPNLGEIEQGIEKSAEKYEQKSETGALSADVGLTTVLPTPVIDDTTDGTVVDDTTTIVAPLIANDDDLIEKEWVDRAKKIVTDTPNNPHMRDKEVSNLKVDYIKKRYGRDLGVTE